MRFDVITLLPELFAPHLSLGITRRAFASAQVDVHLWPLREHAEGRYRRVDDRPFGGGPGMVMLAEPLQRALDAVRAGRAAVAADAAAAPVRYRIALKGEGERTSVTVQNSQGAPETSDVGQRIVSLLVDDLK